MGDQWKPSWDNRIGFVHDDENIVPFQERI